MKDLGDDNYVSTTDRLFTTDNTSGISYITGPTGIRYVVGAGETKQPKEKSKRIKLKFK